jgi:hypothetical protein
MASKKADAASISGSVSPPLQEAIVDEDQANEIAILLCMPSAHLASSRTTRTSPVSTTSHNLAGGQP